MQIKPRVKRKRQTTLTDIAQQAGVAPMTVSRVVNGSGYVSTELRQRIEKAIARLKYSPNRLARSLKGNPSNVIGVLLPDLTNPFSAELARGIENALAARGYYTFVVSADGSGRREDAAIEAFSDHRVEGAVLATRCSSLDARDVARISRDRFPVLIVGSEFSGEPIDRVTARYREGGFLATEHLILSGRRRIAFAGSSLHDPCPLLRFRGYLDALRQYGMAVDENLIAGPARRISWCSQRDGYECAARLLDLSDPPDAIFARNDFAAFGAMHAMSERGIRVPDDIALVGFDDVPLAAYAATPLTTVKQFAYEQGMAAAGILLDRIEGRGKKQVQEKGFPCELVVRQSSAAAKAAATAGVSMSAVYAL